MSSKTKANILTPDELLTTTRAVRKRLDLGRPVGRKVIEECIAIAQQAPSGGNGQEWHFVVVTDAKKRARLAEVYRGGSKGYFKGWEKRKSAAPLSKAQSRLVESALYLMEHLQDVPVLVIPCLEGRPEGSDGPGQASYWGSIFPAAWSFMLAARARGLGTALTTLHLNREEEAAKILGIPYQKVTQACLIPVAYTKGHKFRRGPRKAIRTMTHWDVW